MKHNPAEEDDLNPDSYLDERGFIVFTARYHLNRGYCCGNGCRHCPFKFIKVPEPKRSDLLTLKRNEKRKT